MISNQLVAAETMGEAKQGLDMLREMGARLVFSADCHDASMIDFGFALAADYAREHGFRTFWELIGGTWEEVEL